MATRNQLSEAGTLSIARPTKTNNYTAAGAAAFGGIAIISALVLGVGIPGHLVIRHVVQTLPVWTVIVLGFRRSRFTGSVGFPLFLFWLAMMSLIWSYLLGISHILSGHFSPLEVAMTITVGAGSVAGLASCFRVKPWPSVASSVGLFVALAAIQWGCFWASFLPAIAHR